MEGATGESGVDGPGTESGHEEITGVSSETLTEVGRDSPLQEQSSPEDTRTWITTPIVGIERASTQRARRVPAVKVIMNGGEWVVVPLSLSDLGSLLDEHHDFTDWDCYDVRGGWQGVQAEFKELIDYSPRVLDVMLEALRLGRFSSGEPLSLRAWSSLCWGRDTPVRVETSCCKCRTSRWITPRHLPVLPKELSVFQCPMIGMTCPNPVSLKKAGIRREAPASIGVYRSDKIESAELKPLRRDSTDHTLRDSPRTITAREAQGTITLQKCLGHKERSFSLKRQQEDKESTAFADNRCDSGKWPHPREFIVGVEATGFDHADPTEEELVEFYAFRNTSDWRQYTKALQRRGGEANSFMLEGKDDVIQFREWEKRIRYQFDSWVLINPVVRAELAMTTFVLTAQDWWGAHRQRNPCLRVTFAQLCEWITTELVPSASHASALEAWTCLEFKGNLERYFKQLDDLRFYHHIDPCAAHSIAAKPFGPEFQARIRIMDKEAGSGGIAFPSLKELIRAHCAERGRALASDRMPEFRRRDDRRREIIPARSVTTEKKGRPFLSSQTSRNQGTATNWRATPPNSIPLTTRPPHESRAYFCQVCGDQNHIWTQCPQKQTKGCAACGSEAHLVRNCAQRWQQATATPHRWDRVSEDKRQDANEWDITKDVSPSEPSNVPARRVGIYPVVRQKAATEECQAHRVSIIKERNPPKEGSGTTKPFHESLPCLPTQEIFVDPTNGIAPCPTTRIEGELLYPIRLNNVMCTALWDPGAGASFISVKLANELGLVFTELPRPIRLEVWDGPGVVITKCCLVPKVEFGSKTGSWTFMVDPRPPHDIVLGIDWSRSWHLTVNPNNDFLICIAPAESRAFETPEIASWNVKREAGTRNACSMEGDAYLPLNDWEERACLKTFLCNTRKDKESVLVKEGTDNEFVISRTLHSVTAGTPEEEGKREEWLESLEPELASLVREFPRLFQPPDAVPPDRTVKHRIQLKPNAVPVRRAPYIVGGEKLQAMKEQVSQLQRQGWIEPSTSPWGAPVLFVPKKEKVFRMCGDFRDLNALTIDDSFPLPRIEVMLHRAGGATIFSKLDLASGFHQISLSEESKPLTTFCLPEPVEGNCLWQWTVMPFGLKNAPPTFQRAMTLALKGCEEFATVYIDDILIFSRTRSEHLQHLRQVFKQLDHEAYHARLTKCLLLKEEVEFLGHCLSAEGLRASPHKMEALAAWQPPFSKAKYVKQFLGLVLWYKAFIPHMATIAAPLFPLTSSKKRFEWSEAATEAVRTLQKQIAQAPCLARWDPILPTRVVTDASKVGIGAVLEQRHEAGWRPVAFWSRRLKDPETRYHTTDREWLAVVEAVSRRWKGFLEGRPFLVCSDHMALERKLTKSSHEPPVTDRQSRWIEALMPFALTFEYIKGQDNTVADALSRCPVAARSVTVVKVGAIRFPGLDEIGCEARSELSAAPAGSRKGYVKRRKHSRTVVPS